MMEFRWELHNDQWVLSPSPIAVRQVDGYWLIYVGDCPMQARYTSEQGAKLDAWQFAVSKRESLFGAYRVRLLAA